MANLSHTQKRIIAALQNGGALSRHLGAWRVYEGDQSWVATAETCERLMARDYITAGSAHGVFVLTEKGQQA